MNPIKYLTAFSAISIAAGFTLPANAIVMIDFDSDVNPNQFLDVPNGFQSVNSNLISFSDSLPTLNPNGDLQVGTFFELPQTVFPPENGGLGTLLDDNSQLEISFTGFFQELEFEFFNDDQTVPVGSIALLSVFNNTVDPTTPIAQEQVLLDRAQFPGQSISVSVLSNPTLAFDFATFSFANPATLDPLDNVPLEIIDNLVAVPGNPINPPGPNPIPFEAEGTAGLVALGGYAWYRNRKKRN